MSREDSSSQHTLRQETANAQCAVERLGIENDVLARILDDQSSIGLRTLDHYVAMFPDGAEVVQEVWGRVTGNGSLTAGADRPEDAPLLAGRGVIAGYRLIRELGRGGQGIVYLAQDDRLGRSVALKVLGGAYCPSEGELERFRREAAVVARLAHPALGVVHDVGEDSGLHYIALGYVEGESLATHIARAQVGDEGESESGIVAFAGRSSEKPASSRDALARVLGFFEEAARALHLAHEAGVLHRDVKPGNLMVKAGGRPVVLDFGLARDSMSDTRLTSSGDRFGTPAYMSPEQVQRGVAPVDRRSDVYGLAASMYEAVTLRRLFGSASQAELFAAIVEREPEDASRRNPALPRDLATVLSKALAKGAEDRYATALDLADELRRVRLLEPIQARPVRAWTRLKRWSQRDPLLATTLAALLVVLVGSSVLLFELYRGAVRASAAAQSEARKSQAISEYLIERLLAAPNPWIRSHRTRIVDVLGDAVAGVDAAFSETPELGASIRDVLGRSYLGLGSFETAERLLSQALDERRRRLGSVHRDTLATEHALGRTLYWMGQSKRARRHLERVLTSRTAELGDAHAETIAAMGDLALVELRIGEEGAARSRATRALELADQHHGAVSEIAVTALGKLAEIEMDRGRMRVAEGLLERGVRAVRSLRGGLHAETVSVEVLLAEVQAAANGHADRSLPDFESVVARATEVLGANHPITLRAVSSWAELLEQADLQRSESMVRQARSVSSAALGAAHRITVGFQIDLARCLRKQRRFVEAESLCRETLATCRREFGDGDAAVGASLDELSSVVRDRGDLEGAEALGRDAVAELTRAHGVEHAAVARAYFNLASTLIEREGNTARDVARRALNVHERVHGPGHPNTVRCLLLCVDACLLEELWTAAVKNAGRAHAVCVANLQDGDPLRLQSEVALGRALLRADEPSQAHAHLRHAYDVLRGAGRHRELARTRVRSLLSEALVATGSAAEAARLPRGIALRFLALEREPGNRVVLLDLESGEVEVVATFDEPVDRGALSETPSGLVALVSRGVQTRAHHIDRVSGTIGPGIELTARGKRVTYAEGLASRGDSVFVSFRYRSYGERSVANAIGVLAEDGEISQDVRFEPNADLDDVAIDEAGTLVGIDGFSTSQTSRLYGLHETKPVYAALCDFARGEVVAITYAPGDRLFALDAGASEIVEFDDRGREVERFELPLDLVAIEWTSK